jgi:hypothetical protein
VACLARHLNHGLSFCEEERDERVPQVVGTEIVQAGRGRGGSEDPLAPVSPVFVVPGRAVEPREDKRFFAWTSALQAPLSKFGDFPMTRKLLLGVKRRAEQRKEVA